MKTETGENKQLCRAIERQRAQKHLFLLFWAPAVGFFSPFYFLAAIRKLHRKETEMWVALSPRIVRAVDRDICCSCSYF